MDSSLLLAGFNFYPGQERWNDSYCTPKPTHTLRSTRTPRPTPTPAPATATLTSEALDSSTGGTVTLIPTPAPVTASTTSATTCIDLIGQIGEKRTTVQTTSAVKSSGYPDPYLRAVQTGTRYKCIRWNIEETLS